MVVVVAVAVAVAMGASRRLVLTLLSGVLPVPAGGRVQKTTWLTAKVIAFLSLALTLAVALTAIATGSSRRSSSSSSSGFRGLISKGRFEGLKRCCMFQICRWMLPVVPTCP